MTRQPPGSAGELVGSVGLRPVRAGVDAVLGIAKMGDFAAGARADEVIVAWETHNLATECQHPPRHEGSALNIVRATATEHTLCIFPYRPHPTGLLVDGRPGIAPHWTSPGAAQPDATVEPVITSLLALSFQPPVTEAEEPFPHIVARLDAQKYQLRLRENSLLARTDPSAAP